MGRGAALRLGLLAVLVLLPAGHPAAAATLDFSAIDEAALDAVNSGDIPGAVILVGRGDDVLYRRAFGSRTLLPGPRPMTIDTIFDLASLTKPLGTTLAVMSLVERGAVRLDAPLGAYLKEFRPGAFRQVTIRRMMTHTAGFPPVPPDADLRAGFPRAARALARRPLGYAPGTYFEYSDEGFILLGEVVRRVSGQPLDRYLERTVFKPLGLRDTSFHPPAALHDRIAPTQFHLGHLMQGEVHDPRARILRGVAGNAGMFSTAHDVARLCRALVDGGALGGQRILRETTVQLMWTRAPEAGGVRTLGWDISSAYSRNFAPFFPPGSVGHTGYTGTSVWLDPVSRVYVVLLTNRVHPNEGGAARIRELRTRVSAAVGAALFAPADTLTRATSGPPADASASRGGSVPAADPPEHRGVPAIAPTRPGRPGKVRSGLDVLEEQQFALLAHQRVGLVTNQTGVDGQGRRAIDVIATAPGVKLQAIFSPEHGLHGDVDRDVPNSRDLATGRPVWSLYGGTRRPSADMLAGVTALVFDIQDVGVRYYTYLTTLVYLLEEASRHGLPVIVLDRPNPINGRVIEGPLMDPDLKSFTGPHPIPVRTGLTVGEFARLVAGERELPVSLTVVPMVGWSRSRWFDETGLGWVNPSPNIRSLTEALLYSGIGLLEATNLSVGRGTDTPFEVVGAPWIDAMALAEAMNRERLPGVRFEPVWFTPTADTYARLACGGVRFVVTDREAIRPVTIAFALARTLRARYRDQWRPEKLQNLLVNRSTMWGFLGGAPLERLLAWAEIDRSSFLNRRASYLIYP